MVKTTWSPGTIVDVEVTTKRGHDPEARLFTADKQWYVVSSVEALRDMCEWKKDPGLDHKVVVLAVDAIRERPSWTAWETNAIRIFFVMRAHLEEAGFSDGPVNGSARYRLRDLAAEHELAADGTPLLR